VSLSRALRPLLRVVGLSLVLPAGAVIALVWANIAHESYERFAGALRFSVNDVGISCGRLAACLGLQIFDDEDLLAPSDEAELAASHFLDGRRILGEPPGFLAETRVFGLLAGDCRRQLVVLTSRAQHDEQSLVADQGVDDDDHS